MCFGPAASVVRDRTFFQVAPSSVLTSRSAVWPKKGMRSVSKASSGTATPVRSNRGLTRLESWTAG